MIELKDWVLGWVLGWVKAHCMIFSHNDFLFLIFSLKLLFLFCDPRIGKE